MAPVSRISWQHYLVHYPADAMRWTLCKGSETSWVDLRAHIYIWAAVEINPTHIAGRSMGAGCSELLAIGLLHLSMKPIHLTARLSHFWTCWQSTSCRSAKLPLRPCCWALMCMPAPVPVLIRNSVLLSVLIRSCMLNAACTVIRSPSAAELCYASQYLTVCPDGQSWQPPKLV